MCSKYGREGCPYQGKCNLTPDEIADGLAASEADLFDTQLEEIDAMSNTANLFAQLKKKQGAPVAVEVTPTVAAVAAVASPEAQPSLKEHVAANPRAAFLTTSPEPAPAAVAAPAVAAPAVAGINPPESALPPAPAVGQVAAPEPKPAKAPRAAKAATAAPAGLPTIDAGEALRFAKALRAGCDAFISAMEAA
jgi:chemotaxis protein histidine kinase CheA